MNLPNLVRRVLSALRFGRSPKPKQLDDGTYVSRPQLLTDPARVDIHQYDAYVVRLEQETRRIDPAAQRAVPVAPDDKFGAKPASPRHRRPAVGRVRVLRPRPIVPADRNERRWH